MILPENESSLGVNEEISRKFSILETLPREVTPESAPLQLERQPEVEILQAIPRPPEVNTQIEIQPHQEKGPTSEKPKKERLGWFRRQFRGKKEEYREKGELLIGKLEKEGVILTEEDKRKLYSIPVIWTIHAVISTAIGVPVAGGSILSLVRYRDFSRLPSLLSYNLLIPGGIRLVSTVAFEQFRHITFDGWSKVASTLSGWGMPVEIAMMSRKSAKHRIFFKVLLEEVKEHYITNPLARARELYRVARKIIKGKQDYFPFP